MKSLKSLVALGMAVVTLGTTTACTEAEVLTAAIVIGAAVAAPSDYRPVGRGHHHRRDRWDRDHRGGRGGHGRGGHGRPNRGPRRNFFSAQAAAVAPAEFVSTDARVIKIADKYEITDYAATYIARAIILAEQKSLVGVQELGLEKGDLQKVYQGKELETAKLEAVSEKLILPRAETQRLLKEMTEDIQIEKATRGL